MPDPPEGARVRLIGRWDRHAQHGLQFEFELLQVDYGDAIERPREVAVGVCGFLERDLDVEAMVAAVDSWLYRQCGDGSV